MTPVRLSVYVYLDVNGCEKSITNFPKPRPRDLKIHDFGYSMKTSAHTDGPLPTQLGFRWCRRHKHPSPANVTFKPTKRIAFWEQWTRIIALLDSYA